MHQRDFSVCYRDWPEGRNSHRWADDQISFSTQTDRTSQRERGFDARTHAPFYANLLNHYKCEMPAEEKLNWLSITLVIYVLFYCIISGRRSNRLKFYLSLLLLLLYSLSWDAAAAVIHFRLDFWRPAAARTWIGFARVPFCSRLFLSLSFSRVKRDLLYYTLQE
jgi:hypothetical protein